MVFGWIFGGSKRQKYEETVKKAETEALLIWNYKTAGGVYSVSLSSHGRYVAVGSKDKRVYFFTRDGKLLWSYETGGGVSGVSVSSDCRYIAAGSSDRKVYFFGRSGELLWSYETDTGVCGVSVSSDGSYVVAGSGRKVYLFDRSGELLWSYKTCSGVFLGYNSVSISSHGSYIAAGSLDKKVFLFARDGKLIWSYKTGGWVESVSITPDGSYIAAGSGRKVYLFARDGKLLWSYRTGFNVKSVSISSDGSYIAAGSGDGKVYFFDRSGRLLWSYETGSAVGEVSISSDGRYVAARSGRRVYLFTKEGKLLWSYKTGGGVRGVSISSDGRYIAAGSRDNKVYLLFGDNQGFLSEINALIEEAKKLGIPVQSHSNIETLIERGELNKAIKEAEKLKAELKYLIESRKQVISELKTLKSEIEGLSSKALKLGISVPSRSNIETLSKSKEYERALEEARKLKQELEEAIAKAKPEISIALDTTEFRLRAGTKAKLLLKNNGSTAAEQIEVAAGELSGFEHRIISTPEKIELGDSEPVELWLRFTEEGDLPLSFKVSYKDALGREYEHEQEFWVTVSSAFEAPTPQPTQQPATPQTPQDFTPRPTTPKTFPAELAEAYTEPEFIGRGGFARVFKAKRKSEGREVAIKLPLSPDPATGKSFIRELQNWTKLKHGNIVAIYDYNILPIPYFEMELCDCSLADISKPMEVKEAAYIIFNVADGLRYAHSQGIIHRDLKPQNIMLSQGVPKISDWGLSKVLAESSSSVAAFTPYYAAPEQISRKFGKPDARTDIWQLGVIFYELVTGELPFRGEDFVEVTSAIVREEPALPSELNPEAKDVEHIIMTCLQKGMDERYQSAVELQRELALYLGMSCRESLKESLSVKDFSRSAYYCGELLVVNLKLGDGAGAYKYASDLLEYCKGEVEEGMRALAEQIKARLEERLEIPQELIEKAEILVHKLKLGFERV